MPQRHRLANISTRADVQTGDRVLVGGFILGGEVPTTILVRGLGPSLGAAGVDGAVSDPMVELYDSTGTMILANDNWSTNTEPLPNGTTPSSPLESAFVATLPPGNYTAVLHGVGASSGVALIELYSLDSTTSQIKNISTRSEVGTGDKVMIGGVIIDGMEPTRVIVRALGPSLAAAGVSGALPNPVLELHNSNGSLLFQNDDWRDAQEAQIIATGVPPTDEREAAIVATLAPGNYTAIVRGKANSTGVALIEVYNLEND